MTTYQTAELAAILNIHPNTVRLYEEMELIPKAERRPNGYRIFTEFHLEQLRLARLAFQIEVLQNGLRKKIISMVKLSAKGDFDAALALTQEYLQQVEQERVNAEEAIEIAAQILSGGAKEQLHSFKRKETAEYLNISMDALRNWEMNGLLTIKRRENGYRIYTDEDLQQLKLIRSLRCANYSLEAILRMLRQLSSNPDADIKQVLNTPTEDTDIIAVCDQLISSLSDAAENARTIIVLLQNMKHNFS